MSGGGGPRLVGRAWVFGDQVDTDVMFPGDALRLPVAEASTRLFEPIRPGWADLVVPGDVVVGGRSFGIGSARPVAALLRHLGVAAVLAETMSSLFQRNCVNAGLPALAVPGIAAACAEGDELHLDLVEGVVTIGRTGGRLRFPPLPAPVAALVEAGGVRAMLRAEGYLP